MDVREKQSVLIFNGFEIYESTLPNYCCICPVSTLNHFYCTSLVKFSTKIYSRLTLLRTVFCQIHCFQDHQSATNQRSCALKSPFPPSTGCTWPSARCLRPPFCVASASACAGGSASAAARTTSREARCEPALIHTKDKDDIKF